VKIAPGFSGPTVYVPDASRVADVLGRLLNPAQRGTFEAANHARQEELRERHRRCVHVLTPLAEARARRLRLAFGPETIAIPAFLGRRAVADVPIADLVPFIDWTFFFTAWELKGRFPAILTHPQYGEAARELYDEARRLLDRLQAGHALTASGVYGFWPANADGDDLVLFGDTGRGQEVARFPMLRQQESAGDTRPLRSLADFVAPLDSGVIDYLGAFAVTAGLGADEAVQRFAAQHDDYHAIMVKAIADRLAEAFAEWLHQHARRDWGFGTHEALSFDDLLSGKYRGIRPAYGYPACPDHSEKRTLFGLLGATGVGMALTETCMMRPAASVSGLYFAHPQASYFTVGHIGRDQLEDYARRKGISVDEAERWLGPAL